jgi:hypothetical protein
VPWPFKGRRQTLGDDHPDTLINAHNRAIELGERGQHQQARELDEDTLERRRRVLGDDHPGTLANARALAAALQALGETERSAALLAEFGLAPDVATESAERR